MATNYVMGLVLVETVAHPELVVIKCSTLPGAGGHYAKIFYTGLVVATNYVMATSSRKFTTFDDHQLQMFDWFLPALAP